MPRSRILSPEAFGDAMIIYRLPSAVNRFQHALRIFRGDAQKDAGSTMCLRRRCSQFRSVAALMPRSAENLCYESPSRSRIAHTSGSSHLKERFGFAVPLRIRPPSLMLSTNSAKSSFFMGIPLRSGVSAYEPSGVVLNGNLSISSCGTPCCAGARSFLLLGRVDFARSRLSLAL